MTPEEVGPELIYGGWQIVKGKIVWVPRDLCPASCQETAHHYHLHYPATGWGLARMHGSRTYKCAEATQTQTRCYEALSPEDAAKWGAPVFEQPPAPLPTWVYRGTHARGSIRAASCRVEGGPLTFYDENGALIMALTEWHEVKREIEKEQDR